MLLEFKKEVSSFLFLLLKIFNKKNAAASEGAAALERKK